jgi:ribosomal protein S18 acetylase RimI-like enzyme
MLRIRRLIPADAERLATLFKAIAGDQFFDPYPLTREEAAFLTNLPEKSRNRYYLAELGETAVGVSMLRGWDEGYEIPTWGGCIHPKFRGRGLGQQLFLHGIDEAVREGAERLRLTVYKDNARAIHIYRKYGFQFSELNEIKLVGYLALNTLQLQ